MLRRGVGIEQVGETCRGRVGLHVTESESWGKGDDGGSDICMDQLGGRVGVD